MCVCKISDAEDGHTQRHVRRAAQRMHSDAGTCYLLVDQTAHGTWVVPDTMHGTGRRPGPIQSQVPGTGRRPVPSNPRYLGPAGGRSQSQGPAGGRVPSSPRYLGSAGGRSHPRCQIRAGAVCSVLTNILLHLFKFSKKIACGAHIRKSNECLIITKSYSIVLNQRDFVSNTNHCSANTITPA